MAEIMRLFGQGQFGFAAFQGDRAAGHRQQPGDHPQQRGFARSIGADDGQRLAASGLEIEARKTPPGRPAHT